MSNPMKYIRDLEAAGFERTQAEAQVQVVLDALEGDLVTKSDFALFQERLENKFTQFQQQMVQQLVQLEQRVGHNIKSEVREAELRMLIRMGIGFATSTTITIAVLTWLIKI